MADIPDVVVGEEVAASPKVKPGKVSELLQVEELVKRTFGKIEKLRGEAKLQKEMLEDSFKNDEVYREHEEKAKEAVKIRTSTKNQILKQPAVVVLAEKLKGLKQEIKEEEAFLSDYLQQYQTLSGSSEIETDEGVVRRIVTVAKLVRSPEGNL
jgi:hypothetical protein